MKKFEELTFRDDYMFSAVLSRNLGICKEILEIILDRKVSDVRYVNTEQYFKFTPESKAVRLDVYLEDEAGKAYDMELQAWDEENIAARSRYYQASMDLGLMARGRDYVELNESYVIFICMKDYFGQKRLKYTYENRCIETGIPLRDGTRKIFLNAKGTEGKVSTELKEFLDYIATNRPTGELTRRIDRLVEEARKDGKLQMDYIPYELALDRYRKEGVKEGRKEGIKEGRKEGIKEGDLKRLIVQIRKKIIKGKSMAEIADDLETNEAEIRPVYEAITESGTDTEPETILQNLVLAAEEA